MKAMMKTGLAVVVVMFFFCAACAKQDETQKPKEATKAADVKKTVKAPKVPKVADAEAPGKILATVGTDKITEKRVFAPLAMMPPQFRSRYETPEGRKKLLDRAVQMSLLSQEARRLNIMDKEEISRRIKEMTDQLIVQELTRQEVLGKITITDADIQAYYDANKDRFKKDEKVRVNLILVSAKDGATKKEIKKKKALAEKALARIKKGEDFTKVARDVSEDQRTKNRGGNSGLFSRGRRSKLYGEAFEEKAFSLEQGKLSDVFKAKDGFYIIKVVEKKPMVQETIEKVKPRIERMLKNQKQKTAMEDYIAALKKKYPVKMMEQPAKAPVKAPAKVPAEPPVK